MSNEAENNKLTIEQILFKTHAERDYNYEDIRRAFGLYREEVRKELYPLIFIGKQWKLWQLLSTTPASTGMISKATGIPSKNASTQLSQMSRTGLVKIRKIGRLKYWYK